MILKTVNRNKERERERETLWGGKDGKILGGGVAASQLERDWISAVKKVSANTNSSRPHDCVQVPLSEHQQVGHPSILTSTHSLLPRTLTGTSHLEDVDVD